MRSRIKALVQAEPIACDDYGLWHRTLKQATEAAKKARHSDPRLVYPDGLAHGGLDVKHLDVLPVLLEERDEEVEGKLDVLDDLRVGHAAVSDGDVEAEHLLKLELDRGFELVNLGGEVVLLLHERGELTGLVEARAEQTRDLLNQALGGEELVVLLSCAREGNARKE
uniref:Uncharacterized protein n=1 Tax=Chrysotila carterae TaxID=13221 RepID=A0A7S4B518_CHRCT|eukprot:2383954-Pleurochrysis_carterae.AAC.1